MFETIIQYTVVAFVTGFVGYLWGIAKDKRQESIEEERAKEELISNIAATNQKLVSWRNAVELDVRQVHETLEILDKKIEGLVAATQAMTRDRIIQACRHFIELGSITIVARDNLMTMHESYKACGGNGICDTYVKQMLSLKVSDNISGKEVDP